VEYYHKILKELKLMRIKLGKIGESMMRKILIPGILLMLLILPLALAEKKVDVEVNILTYEIKDYFVVGDSFYYNITLTNSGDEIINNTFEVSIYDSSKNQLNNPTKYDINLNLNESTDLLAKGGKENETAIFPFETSGNYRLDISATTPLDFYRWIEIKEDSYLIRRYIRQNKDFVYIFDVMPRWQYNLYKSSEEANQKIIQTNDKILTLTDDMNKATQSVKTATWFMLAIAIFTAFIAYKSYKSSFRQ
jgi:hypothetical protein